MGRSCWLLGVSFSIGLVGALLAFPVCSMAQITASVSGTVADETGAVISGATFNSLSSPPTRVTVQDSSDPDESRGPSDFAARHRFVARVSYNLPLGGNTWAENWQFAAVLQSQSGNPVNIVTTNSTLNGTANTVRPDLTGEIRIIGQPEQWFDTTAFTAVNRFGNLPRNAGIGPRFDDMDVSMTKALRSHDRDCCCGWTSSTC